eukprot:168090-Alexandrium_andersonii.AAC.1
MSPPSEPDGDANRDATSLPCDGDSDADSAIASHAMWKRAVQLSEDEVQLTQEPRLLRAQSFSLFGEIVFAAFVVVGGGGVVGVVV